MWFAAEIPARSGTYRGRGRCHPGAGGPNRSRPAAVQRQTLDGHDFHGESLLGKPAVLWFWAPWCPTCQGEAPVVGQVAASHPEVTFVGVAGLDQVPAMQEFVNKYPVKTFTQLADTDRSVWANFGVTQQPAYAFVDPHGNVDVVRGRMSQDELTRRVTALTSR